MKLSLLIAAADEFALGLYRRFFTSCGHEVATVSGGLECIQRLQDSSPDVLILDSELPWGGADGVLARLREDDELVFEVPVVLIAAEGMAGAYLASLEPPVIQCLRKPFRLPALLEAVCSAAQEAPTR